MRQWLSAPAGGVEDLYIFSNLVRSNTDESFAVAFASHNRAFRALSVAQTPDSLKDWDADLSVDERAKVELMRAHILRVQQVPGAAQC